MLIKSWSVRVAMCIWIETIQASEATVQPTSLLPVVAEQVQQETVKLVTVIDKSHVFDQYSEELVFTSRIYHERFHYPSRLNWIRRSDLHGYDIHDSVSSVGATTIKDMILSATRETAVDHVPFGEWEQSVDEWGRNEEYNPAFIVRFVAWAIRSSIGNTEEIEMEAISAQPSYYTLKYLKQFKWQSNDGFWNTEYGWRPFRDNPYVYFNNNFGHFKDKPLLRNELRCFSYLRPNNLGVIKLESQTIITVSDISQVVIGGALYPSDINTSKHQPSVSIRYESLLLGGIGSIGTVSLPHEQMYTVMWWKSF